MIIFKDILYSFKVHAKGGGEGGGETDSMGGSFGFDGNFGGSDTGEAADGGVMGGMDAGTGSPAGGYTVGADGNVSAPEKGSVAADENAAFAASLGLTGNGGSYSVTGSDGLNSKDMLAKAVDTGLISGNFAVADPDSALGLDAFANVAAYEAAVKAAKKANPVNYSGLLGILSGNVPGAIAGLAKTGKSLADQVSAVNDAKDKEAKDQGTTTEALSGLADTIGDDGSYGSATGVSVGSGVNSGNNDTSGVNGDSQNPGITGNYGAPSEVGAIDFSSGGSGGSSGSGSSSNNSGGGVLDTTSFQQATADLDKFRFRLGNNIISSTPRSERDLLDKLLSYEVAKQNANTNAANVASGSALTKAQIDAMEPSTIDKISQIAGIVGDVQGVGTVISGNDNWISDTVGSWFD